MGMQNKSWECRINHGEGSNLPWSNIPDIIKFDKEMSQTYPESIYAHHWKNVGIFSTMPLTAWNRLLVSIFKIKNQF